MTPRLVLDTQVWLDLLHFRDPACAALDAALTGGHWQAVVDAPCREEWQRVLDYPRLGIADAEQQTLGKRFDRLCLRLDDAMPSGPTLPRCRDPDDQKFLALAVAATARLLLSRDAAVLALARRMHRDHGLLICRPDHADARKLLHSDRTAGPMQ